MMKRRGLAFRLSVLILSGVSLIFLATFFYNYWISHSLVLQYVERNASNMSYASVNKIQGIFQSVEKIPYNTAYLLENNSYSQDELTSLLKNIMLNNKEIYGTCTAFEPYLADKSKLYYAPYAFLGNNGEVKSSMLGNDMYNYFYMDWYQIPKILDSAIWSEPYFDVEGGDILMATFSVPFHQTINGKEMIKGIATADISLKWLQEIISQIRIFKTGYAYIISQRGTFITNPVKEMIGNESIFSVAEETSDTLLRSVGRKMIHGGSGFVRLKAAYGGKTYWMYYQSLPINGWSLAMNIPENELFSDLRKLNRNLLLIGISGFLLLLTIILVISSRITRPLRVLAGKTSSIGKGDFEVDIPEIRSHDEIGMLSLSLKRMQRELKSYVQNLKETTAAKEKIESELKIAHDIQQGMIPKIFPPFPERRDVDLFAILEPAREVGGDLYDFFFIDDNKLCFAVGDASGKGIPSSLLMAITRTLLRAKTIKGMHVDEIMRAINVELCKDNENAMFVTMFLGIIDLETGKIEFCNAGHNYPFIMKNDGNLEKITNTHGTPVGLFEGTKYGRDTFAIAKGDSFLLYTDGVSEAMNPELNLFGEHGIEESIIGRTDVHPREITSILLEKTRQFASGAEQSDDITILVLTYYFKNKAMERQLRIKNNLAELPVVTAFVEKMSREWKFGEKLLFDLNLVLEELLSNIIFYAYDDKEVHEIQIDFLLDGRELEVIIGDDGKEFNPIRSGPPLNLDKPVEEREVGGLGIHFVKTLMDDLEYNRIGGKNMLTLKKKLD